MDCATQDCGKPGTERFESGDVGSYYCRDCHKAIMSFHPSPSGEGWQTMPKEPTEAMVDALADGIGIELVEEREEHHPSFTREDMREGIKAMLAAAPPAPGSEPSSALAEAMELLRRAQTFIDAVRPLLGRPADKVDGDIAAFLASHSKGE